MAAPKKKAKAKTVIEFRDLKSRKNPKGGDTPTESLRIKFKI